MNFLQKVGRVLLLSGTFVVGSIFFAVVGVLGLYLYERGRAFSQAPEFINGMGILLAGSIVNTTCVWVLLQIKNADRKLIPPSDESSG